MNPEPTNRTRPRGCPRDCETSARNNYYDRKPITPLSFQVEQAYGIERRRLLNRAIHGWGVVYGFPVAPDDEGGGFLLKIGEGLALDKYGRELSHSCRSFRWKEFITLDPPPSAVQPDPDKPRRWLLRAHYAEKKAAPVTVRDSCRHEWTEWDQTCETVRFSIQLVPPGGVPSAKSDDCSQTKKSSECETPDQLICKTLADLCVASDPGRLQSRDEPDGPVFVDLDHGVPLALLERGGDDQAFKVVDACAPRRLVKRNDLLFDLIRARDLTHISAIGWSAWHESEAEIPFDDFVAALDANGDGDAPDALRFDIEFSAPVRPPSRAEDCFAMTILIPDEEGGWWRSLRAPIDEALWSGQDDASPELFRRVSLGFNADWLREAVRGRYTMFRGRSTRVEIEIRGDLILDCHGRAVDANANGRQAPPTGNGTPGGVFLSTFHVGPAPSPQSQETDEESGS